MRFLSHRLGCWKSLLGAAILGLTATATQAQPPTAPEALPTKPTPTATTSTATTSAGMAPGCCAPYSGYVPTPGCAPSPGYMPSPGYTPYPGYMPSPGGGTPGGMGPGGTGEVGESGGFRSLTSGAGFGGTVAVAPGGYLDSAIPSSRISLRYDGAFGYNRADRAEYFYGAWQELAFHTHGIRGQDGSFEGTFFDPKARGPEQFPGKLNVEEATAAIEYAPSKCFSAFVEIPVRFLNFTNIQEEPDTEAFREPNPGDNAIPPAGNDPAGLSDIRFGFKYALIADPDRYLTTQLRIYSDSGNASRGLGTGHWSVEPSLLYYKQLNDHLEIQGQFTDWIPIAAGPEAGNVLQYGAALGYTVYNRGCFRVTPVMEVVGWTVLSGLESVALPSGETGAIPAPAGVAVPLAHGVQEAAGDTIVNLKFGVRTHFGQSSDVYIGYGRCVTGDRWYKDIVSLEYRFSF
jgi:hypothetical protein